MEKQEPEPMSEQERIGRYGRAAAVLDHFALPVRRAHPRVAPPDGESNTITDDTAVGVGAIGFDIWTVTDLIAAAAIAGVVVEKAMQVLSTLNTSLVHSNKLARQKGEFARTHLTKSDLRRAASAIDDCLAAEHNIDVFTAGSTTRTR
jgi:hypothetical protein